jgi:hypothetical protein
LEELPEDTDLFQFTKREYGRGQRACSIGKEGVKIKIVILCKKEREHTKTFKLSFMSFNCMPTNTETR